jgi:uncharacterized protein YecT (DUF1311 family)
MDRAIPLLAVLTLFAGPLTPSLAATPARADRTEPKLSMTYDRCMSASGGVDPEMRDCISAEYGRQDARLNQTYKTIMDRLSVAQKLTLRETERTWLRTTKNRCDHAGDDNEGGTLQLIEIADCYLSETAKRADALAHYEP